MGRKASWNVGAVATAGEGRGSTGAAVGDADGNGSAAAGKAGATFGAMTEDGGFV